MTELIKESLLSRKEWWCIQAFFTCMRHSHALDPSREAKLSLASHRANASSGHDSPLGVQKLVELHISRWLNESAPAALAISKGDRPWGRDLFSLLYLVLSMDSSRLM